MRSANSYIKIDMGVLICGITIEYLVMRFHLAKGISMLITLCVSVGKSKKTVSCLFKM